MSLEIEVKFYLDPSLLSRGEILDRIEVLGGRSDGRIFERNIRFEDKANSLLERNALLRLRKDRRARLTFKSEVPGISAQDRERFKIFEELEIEVSDFAVTTQILEALGFHPVQIYEKWRETFVMGECLICMDTLPFGEFLEIEGKRETIPGLADRIGLDWDRRILETYLGIFAQLRTALELPFSDVTFDQFRGFSGGTTPEDLSVHIRRFESSRQRPEHLTS
ncbi:MULTISPECIES: class IV adenylate cyclase [Desulfococcus]|jgi:adenylate cyclase class 2|uniref:Adenylate cyclase n=1 Tax=Desulfococcus multivorans DSM 2059 TaxID=1121405 RepID=S7V5U9_DESML|nr:class IV adenylate cyclase [Desulfococcus multivorans]AOY59491.1 Cya: predicted adenylate cyclase [Desulfococcus multivorans]AQV01691.1 hypothetical protein B2D07_13580 [Desulfococcus multivorans]EPR39998.1 adenylate cyclase [Desulfococcus multivorans DSM 2059]MDX9817417.1 class IV adenylate cyclase [Desulfococcus multivorans]SKA01652.1 adenylate cyclase, class 2 [Desulfococcus multivorans DSM 2059]